MNGCSEYGLLVARSTMKYAYIVLWSMYQVHSTCREFYEDLLLSLMKVPATLYRLLS